ncbi:MAG: hypothetical protein JO210_12230 [Acidobacteriaceae bacterium]|nr:hypothetical protein [Acidobacteriaceae bacterium]
MTQRSIRRAAARKARKNEQKKARFQDFGQPVHSSEAEADSYSQRAETMDCNDQDSSAPKSPLSPARLAANRSNAALSTGPGSIAGKSKSCVNAADEAASLSEPKTQTVTALTGRTVLLPSDDAEDYRRHVDRFAQEFNPVGLRECALVQSVADTQWRLMRIPALEMALFARGRSEFGPKFAPEDSVEQPAAASGIQCDLEVFLAYEKQIRNLQLQEGRLRRNREKDLAELKTLQQERVNKERSQLAAAAALYQAAKQDCRSFRPEDHGFEFSIPDLEAYLAGVHAATLGGARAQRAVSPPSGTLAPEIPLSNHA